MQFKAILNGHEIAGKVVNAGEWFGKTWIIEIGHGYSSSYCAVEADCESDAIDELCDHDEFGKSIRMDADDERFDDDETHRAGNAGEPVDLDNVAIHGKAGYSGLKYINDNGSEVAPIEYASNPNGVKDFDDYADCVQYRNERESGFGGDEGDWFYGDDETLTIYSGTFGNDHSPGASAYTSHDTYDTRAEYDARLAELDAMPEYLDDDDEIDD